MATETISNSEIVAISQWKHERFMKLEEAALTSQAAMFDVLALIQSTFALDNEEEPPLSDELGLTDKNTRRDSLLIMARQRTVDAIKTLPL